MDEELIDQTYTPQEITDMTNALNTIKGIVLPKCKNLSPEQRQAFQHSAADRKTYVSKAINYVESNGELLPEGRDLDMVKRDRTFDNQISPLFAEVKILEELYSDTQIAAQTDEYSFLLGVYNKAQYLEKLGTPGMTAIVQDLGQLWKKQGHPKNPPTPPTT